MLFFYLFRYEVVSFFIRLLSFNCCQSNVYFIKGFWFSLSWSKGYYWFWFWSVSLFLWPRFLCLPLHSPKSILEFEFAIFFICFFGVYKVVLLLQLSFMGKVTTSATRPVIQEASNYDEIYMHQSLLFDDSLKVLMFCYFLDCITLWTQGLDFIVKN